MKILGGKKTKALKRDSPKSNIMVYDLKKNKSAPLSTYKNI